MTTPTGVAVEGSAGKAPVAAPAAGVPAPAPLAEPETPRELRQQLKAANKAAKAAQESLVKQQALLDQLQSADPKKLAEAERKIAQAQEELAQKEETLNQFSSFFEELYNQELEAIPEGVREKVQKLSNTGDWKTRLSALRDAASLAGTPAPAPAGTVTNPGARPPVTPPPSAPASVGDLYKSRPTLNGAFRSHLSDLRNK